MGIQGLSGFGVQEVGVWRFWGLGRRFGMGGRRFGDFRFRARNGV